MWYDLFSSFYDASLEPLYRQQRLLARDALELAPDSVVLDVPCGTGQSFPAFLEKLGPGGRVLGVDLSPGMLRQAQKRVDSQGWTGVSLGQVDASRLTLMELEEIAGAPIRPDRLQVFLGMSVFPDPVAIFTHLWSLLAPGGVCVVVDVHADPLGFQGKMVNWLAQADITRRFWEPVEAKDPSARRLPLPENSQHGGVISAVVARKGRE